MKQSGEEKIVYNFFEKNAYLTNPIYGNCMNGIFLMATLEMPQVVSKLK